MANPFQVPILTRRRIVLAIAVALVADILQIAFGPVGWLLPDEVIDVIAMGAITLLLGFHPLLLPTFIVEFIPGVDMLPTWTGCVGAVILLRKRRQRVPPPPPPTVTTDASSQVIDV